jgi:hypothetical protein
MRKRCDATSPSRFRLLISSHRDRRPASMACSSIVGSGQPLPADLTRMWPIFTRVNAPENDDPQSSRSNSRTSPRERQSVKPRHFFRRRGRRPATGRRRIPSLQLLARRQLHAAEPRRGGACLVRAPAVAAQRCRLASGRVRPSRATAGRKFSASILASRPDRNRLEPA